MARLDRLNQRRIDNDITDAKLLNEVYRSLEQSDSVRYVIGSMQPIDPTYTKNTYAQAERVRNQLENNLSETCDYEYQGSVTNDTHIKAKSDIDLLIITKKYHGLEKPQVPANPYKGNPLDDLKRLRKDAEDTLRLAFPKADLDTSGSKSICIEGGSLTRKVDVVPSNWYDTNEYIETNNSFYRGVEILDKSIPCRLANTPFLHNVWIEDKDGKTSGGMRKACRLMKSLKYDTENINLSSYDIVSIAFNMPDEALNQQRGNELMILNTCLSYCQQLQSDSVMRNSIQVPDKHRKVFAEGHATVTGLRQLAEHLAALESDVLHENRRSFQKLADARIEY
jgi:hypothetical protein